MKFFKNTLAIVALFTIGHVSARTMATTTTQPTVPTAITKAVSTVPQVSITPTLDLTKFTCISASVLPVYTHNKKKYVILTRESRGNPQELGGKLFTYDDFSGACEAEDKYEPLISAAREFWEEGNLKKTLRLSLDVTVEFVKNNTSNIIVYVKDADKNVPNSREIKNITYIINFDKYANKLFSNFYPVLEKEMAHYKKLGKSLKQVTLEKDKIAAVLWDDLKNAIINQKNINEPVRVQALVRDNKTDSFSKEQIVLRPFLPIKLRSFFLNQPYEKSENSKIRYYHQ